MLFVLSAKNSERLKEYAEKLLVFIQQHKEDKNRENSTLHLEEIAYTLQVGREPMEESLGIVASSLEEVEEELTKYLVGENSEKLHPGQVKKNKEMISDFETDPELQNTIESWMEQKKYDKLLEFWTKGLNINWSKIYGEQKPRKITLPTYPFAKERYWIEETVTTSFNAKALKQSLLHPLVQKTQFNVIRTEVQLNLYRRGIFPE